MSLDGLTTPQRTSFLISSGCLLTREAYQRLGHFDEELFIDHVDTEYSLRAQALDVPCTSTRGWSSSTASARARPAASAVSASAR